MSERQLRSKNTTTGVEMEAKIADSDNAIGELDNNVVESGSRGNKGSSIQLEIPISDEEQQLPDNQVNNPEKSDDINSMVSKQLDKFMETVMRGFENLQSKIQSDNVKLVENLNK